ncbi:glutaredoxin [Lasius niger]|uniref:Glutaredoxin-related protein 5, mitochondrial n=1 Tax=Lasius niger TaxID=67767 RepID=A0A0J7KDI0_LASNI|nr:glutaredoxin [Lasius niger]
MSEVAFPVIQKLIAENPVMLFMKGDKNFPQCGFSSRVVQILLRLGVAFETCNVLEDDSIRQGIKDFSNWPTIPQLYVKGEFVGGCDILTEMYQNGELKTLLEEKVLKNIWDMAVISLIVKRKHIKTNILPHPFRMNGEGKIERILKAFTLAWTQRELSLF